jgi:hypothetical protein
MTKEEYKEIKWVCNCVQKLQLEKTVWNEYDLADAAHISVQKAKDYIESFNW